MPGWSCAGSMCVESRRTRWPISRRSSTVWGSPRAKRAAERRSARLKPELDPMGIQYPRRELGRARRNPSGRRMRMSSRGAGLTHEGRRRHFTRARADVRVKGATSHSQRRNNTPASVPVERVYLRESGVVVARGPRRRADARLAGGVARATGCLVKPSWRNKKSLGR